MFESLFAELRDRKQQFIVYRTDEQTELEDWFKNPNVTITHRTLPEGAREPFVVNKIGDDVIGTIGLDTLKVLLEPPITRPGTRNRISDEYRESFDVLAGTIFHGMTRRELLAAAREIEDRAYRVGNGTLHVNFRTPSTMQSQIAIYRQLAAETHLGIHIHGADEWTPVKIVGIAYHSDRPEEFDPYWVLAFDGGDDETHACGLVAEYQSDEYNGFWTNDPGMVGNITSILTEHG